MKKMRQLLFMAVTAATLFGYNSASAQGMAINTSGAAAATSAMLDVSSTTQGVLVPRLTTTQRTGIASPAQGLLVFDTNTGGFWFYNSGWVSLSAPTSAAGGDLTGTYPNPTVAAGAITGTKIAANTITTANLPAGATGTSFLRGDNTWQTISGGSGTVTSVTAGTGLSGGTITTSGTISLPNTGMAGTFGDATHVPVLTTDAQGRVTAVSNTAISASGGFQLVSCKYNMEGAGATTNCETGLSLDGCATISSFTREETPFPVACTLDAIAIQGNVEAGWGGVSNLITVTVYKNGVSTGASGTFTYPNTSSAVSVASVVTTGLSASFAAGDRISLNINQANQATGATGFLRVGLHFH